MIQVELRFDGADIDQERDAPRLTGQLQRIWDLMCDNNWRTLQEISDQTGEPHASVSAQLRNLRKARFGSYIVEREYVNSGLYRYRIKP